MLIFLPKCFQARSAGHFIDVRYHKYHHHHHHHHHWQMPCPNVVVATRRRQPVLPSAFLKSEWRQIIHGARSFSTLQVQVVQLSPFGLFHSTPGFPIVPARPFDDHPLAKWLNKYHRSKLVISSEKHWLWIVFISHIADPLLNSASFFKCIQASTEKYAFQTTQKYPGWFFNFCCARFSFNIFQR